MKTTRNSFMKRITARLLCAVVLFGMFPGYSSEVRAAELGNTVYTAPKLLLTVAQENYDLLQDITYNTAEYALSLTDEGGFNILAAGDYTVSYLLTPIAVVPPEVVSVPPELPSAEPSPIPFPSPNTPVTEPTPGAPQGEIPVPTEPEKLPIAFTRIVSVMEKNIRITFNIDPKSLNGKEISFTDGTMEAVVEIPLGSKLGQNQLPTGKRTDTGEAVSLTKWLHSVSGMTYTPEQLAASTFTKDESFTAVLLPDKNEHCTCGAGDTATNHQSSCDLLKLPANQEAYAKKANGASENKNTRNSHITVPKGMFFLSPDPLQGNTPGTYAWIDTFGAVMNAIDSNAPGNTTDYTIIICKAEQTLTAEDVGKTSLFHKLGGRLDGKGQHVTTDDKAGSLTLSA
ncbi:MAG: hypothetical protein RSC76_04185, partial [Oscillospiraceae bacterium]